MWEPAFDFCCCTSVYHYKRNPAATPSRPGWPEAFGSVSYKNRSPLNSCLSGILSREQGKLRTPGQTFPKVRGSKCSQRSKSSSVKISFGNFRPMCLSGVRGMLYKKQGLACLAQRRHAEPKICYCSYSCTKGYKGESTLTKAKAR